MVKSKYDTYRKADRSVHGRLMPLYVGFALMLAGGGGYLYWHDWGLWPPVSARVLSASLEEAGEGRWQPAVTYEYRIDGTTYRSSQLAPFGFPTPSRAVAANLVEQFRETRQFSAYVNPRNPEKAYVIPDTENTAERFFLALFGLGGVAVAIASVFILKSKIRKFG